MRTSDQYITKSAPNRRNRFLGQPLAALASSIAASVNFLLLAYFLRKKLGCLDGWRIACSATKIIVASLVMGVVCWLILDLSRPLFADVMPLVQQFFQVGRLVFVGGLTYLAMAVLLRMEELGKIGRLRSLFPRR